MNKQLFTEQFTVLPEHIKLLSHMRVGWQDCEFGAPEIDPKRPYGNSSVLHDISDILVECQDDEEYLETLYNDGNERFEKLHKETEIALQILLDNLTIEPKTYTRKRYGGKWAPL